MTTQQISNPSYTPFEADDVCEVHMETSGQRGGIDVTVTWGEVYRDECNVGLEFMELTYNFPDLSAAGWWLHENTRR
jgi:hypothetical protein